MKKHFTIYVLLLLSLPSLKAQTTQFAQSFESAASDNWNYTLNPATYNTAGSPVITGSNDVWDVIKEFTGNINLPSEGNLFLGGQDLNNNNGGGAFYHTFTLDAIDVSNLKDMTLSFDYYSKGYDSYDYIKYEILLDNTTPFADNTANDNSVEGTDLDKNTQVWTTVNTVIPNGTSFVRIRIKAKQDGSRDYIGIDNIKLVGVNKNLSIDDYKEKALLKISPNPTTAYIQVSGLKSTVKYGICNINGSEILKGTISNNQKINVQNLANGLYFLRLENGNTIKFIKK